MSRRRGRSRRGQNNTPVVAAIIVVIAAVGLFFLVKSGVMVGGDTACYPDEERQGYCFVDSNAFDELLIVAGNTANSPVPELDFTKGELRQVLQDVFYSTDENSVPNITIISAAGNNQKIPFKNKNAPARNLNASNARLNTLARELNYAITTSPNEPGADYLGAIMEAKDNSSGNNPLILVVGSGYSDSGVLNFAYGNVLKYSKNLASVERLLSANSRTYRGALSQMTIKWHKMGAVVEPQVNMNNYKEDVKTIYEAAFKYLGSPSFTILTNSGGNKPVDTKYYVQPVIASPLTIGTVIDLNENVGQFVPESDALINVNSVRMYLAENVVNNYINGTKLRLTGYIATCYPGSTLGERRARTLKNVLVELGIPESMIEVDGRDGPPQDNINDDSAACNGGNSYSSLPETHRRTVRLRVVD